eukprot:jgi/Bigna1/88523/estExt_fgenesh1_pg.C_330087
MSTTAGERKHSGGASSEVKKKEGVSVLSLAIFVIFIAVGRSVYKARRDKAKLQHHHHHWLPLSQDELRTWRFTPLKSRQSLESSTPDIVEDDLKSDEEEPTNAKESGKKVPEQPKQKAKGTDNGVMHGWKIVCESVPCQQLLPGQLAEGGIISLEGTYGSCFDLIVGDDSLHVTSTSFSGVALLLAVRDSDYVMANTHEGGWQGEVTYRGPVFQPGQVCARYWHSRTSSTLRLWDTR